MSERTIGSARASIMPRYDPPDLAIAAPFWSAVEREQLVLPRCSVCGSWQWYPEPSGTDCSGGSLEWVPVATSGTLYSYSRVRRSFLPGARERVPYVVGLVDLDGLDRLGNTGAAGHDGLPRLVATIGDTPDLAIGARVRATFPMVGERRHLAFVPTSEHHTQEFP